MLKKNVQQLNTGQMEELSPMNTEELEKYMEYARLQARCIKTRYPHIPMDDLQSYAYMGLVDALTKWNPESGATFKTYAYIRIRGCIMDYIRKEGGYSRKAVAKYNRLREAGLDIGASVYEIAQALGISNAKAYRFSIELQPPMIEKSYISDDNVLLKDAIQCALRELPEKERYVIIKHFIEDYSTAEIATLMGVSHNWVNTLVRRALKQMRCSALREFL